MPFHSRSTYTANVPKQWPTGSQVVSLTAGQSLAIEKTYPSSQPNVHYLNSHTANKLWNWKQL